MRLDDYKKDSGYEYGGCWYEDVESLLQKGLLGFCNCGRPEANLVYVMGGLDLIDESNAHLNREQWDAWYSGHKARVLKHFGSDEAAYFFYYWADKEGLTEHGFGIPGWLDEKGHDLLALLHEWKTANNK